MARTCGTILAEYRVQAPDGSVRWLLDRGRVRRQPDGTVHGRGIWLDVTDIRENDTRYGDRAADRPLEAVADHCLKARELLPRGANSTLRLLLDVALLELGRGIAEQVGEDGSWRSH